MQRKIISNKFPSLLFYKTPRTLLNSSPLPPQNHRHYHRSAPRPPNFKGFQNFYDSKRFELSWKPISLFTSSIALRYLNSSSSEIISTENQDDEDTEVIPLDSWEEEEEEVEPKIGDGGDGGGVVFRSCYWGERALSVAQEVLLQFGDDFKLYAFKTSAQGYIYVRLDKLSNKYGCPHPHELENFNRQYKAKLDELGAMGDFPDDLALEVSSPGAERLLKVPDDLNRFEDMPMRVSYLENLEAQCPEKDGVFLLDSIENESGCCVWKLADVKENRDPAAKGRPMNRKLKDWRLRLPYDMVKRVTLFLDY